VTSTPNVVNKHLAETGTLVSPPMFNVDNFENWKERMENFIEYQDVKMWRSITQGLQYINIPGPNGTVIPKPYENWTDEDFNKLKPNKQALTLLKLAAPNHILSKVKNKKSAKELWDGLCELYSDCDDVKEQKKHLLTM
jgi:hypothetical protein